MEDQKQLQDLFNKDELIQTRYKSWVKIESPNFYPFGVDTFYDRFFADDAEFSQADFNKIKEAWDIVDTPWQNNKKSINCIIPLKGIPFCNKTRSKNEFAIIDKSESRFVMEIECYALDAPYGDYFVIKDGWAILGDQRRCIFQRYCQVVFHKKTMLQKKITEGTYKGFTESHYLWLDLAKKKGMFEAPPPPPEPVQPEPLPIMIDDFSREEDFNDLEENAPLNQSSAEHRKSFSRSFSREERKSINPY